MKVFISWSGERSKAVALALHEWLPYVIQAVKPWMSAADIEKGARWSQDIAVQLQDARVGVICLTPENLREPWIYFEAGALSKTLEKTFVCPYLFEVQPSELQGPLVQFQAVKAEKEDTRGLLHTITRALGENALPEERLDKMFDHWWPDLEKRLGAITGLRKKPKSQRSEREILEEILELVRSLARPIPPSSPFELLRPSPASLRKRPIVVEMFEKYLEKVAQELERKEGEKEKEREEG